MQEINERSPGSGRDDVWRRKSLGERHIHPGAAMDRRRETIKLLVRCEDERKKARNNGKNEDAAHKDAKAMWNGEIEKLAANTGGEGDEKKLAVDFSNCKFVLQSKNDQTKSQDGQCGCISCHCTKTIKMSGERIRFDGFIFPKDTSFYKACFLNDVTFRHAVFCRRARFDETQFLGEARFKDVKFYGRALFHGAQFSGDAEFGGAQFFGRALFKPYVEEEEDKKVEKRTRFSRNATFDWVQFRNGAFFEKALLEADARFFLAQFNDFADFTGADFRGDANFYAILSERGFSLTEAKFKTVPNFVQAHFAEAPRLDDIPACQQPQVGCQNDNELQENEKSKFGKADIASKYRALKKLAAQGNDHEHEHKFFISELRARWSGKPGARHFRAAIWLYGCVSGFGGSFLRPFLGWCILLVACYGIYLCSACTPACTAGHWSSAFRLSWENAVPGLGGIKDERVAASYEFLYGKRREIPPTGSNRPSRQTGTIERPKIPGFITVMENLQSFISIVLLFLMALGLRNLFRIR